ncbi:MAG TPA: Rne/Rng family ribonuclease [Bryobacteraceae bacterium]|jgi:Rne/Rng family ribonuclease|nr:Rne/Rng family ribonuclease [Bryobacteraceae bacterium]
MSKELVISANRHETKVALIEDDQLCEVYFQRANEYSLAGSIHKGRVTRVLPGMQSAFVDLGLERDTFLYVSDFLEEHEDFDKVGDERPVREPREPRDRDRDRDRRPPQGPPPVVQPLASLPESIQAAHEGPPAISSFTPIGESRPDDRGADRGADRGERRGRRSRRRRNNGRGFPDSKYAPSGGEQRRSGPPLEAEPQAEPAGPPEILSAASEPVEEVTPLILPGESLKKYREAPPVAKAAIETESEGEAIEEYDEPIHYPAENALPDAPVHHPAAESVLPETTPEIPESIVAVAPPPLPEEYVAAHSIEVSPEDKEPEAEEAVAQENAEDNEGGPAIAPMLDDEEDRDIQAMILGDIEDLDAVEEGGEEAPGEETAGEATPAQESGTASVRERGGRYPHRASRRNRRRRGGPGGSGPGQAGPGQIGPVSASEDAPRSEQAAPEYVRPESTRPQQQVVSRPTQGQPSITDLLKEGQEIIVQIAKEPLGQKGARITSHIALPGRYVVYMPTLEHMGVSRKIGSDEERLRLKRILQGKRPGPVGGFITRTAAEGRSEEDIASDMQFLYNLWQDIRTRAEKRPAPMLLHHDLDIVQRILRDQLADSFKAIWIDNEEHYESVLRFVERFQPALVPKVKLYTRDAPIFDAFGVTAELEKALRPKVWLKSGGYIVINQTEALVAIDVNTGKYVGKSNRLEDTIVKTNTEAIKEIVRQMRLRDLGGIIVIDFIDMDERKNRQKVMQALEEAMRADRAPYKILQFNDFGLVAITRKRVKQSLERTLCSPCPHCEGAGYVKSVQTVVSEILTEARKMARSIDSKDVMLRVHPDVAKVLKSHQNKFLEELEEILRRPVLVKSDPLLHHEKFDLA